MFYWHWVGPKNGSQDSSIIFIVWLPFPLSPLLLVVPQADYIKKCVEISNKVISSSGKWEKLRFYLFYLILISGLVLYKEGKWWNRLPFEGLAFLWT